MANCRNQNQLSAVVDHLATGHSWGFSRAKVINTQRNTYKRKIAESLLMKKHPIVTGNKSSFHLSIQVFKNKNISINYSVDRLFLVQSYSNTILAKNSNTFIKAESSLFLFSRSYLVLI